MKIPNLSDAAYLPYLFKLREFRICLLNEKSKLYVFAFGRFIQESNSTDYHSYNLENLEKVLTRGNSFSESCFIQGKIDAEWINIDYIKTLHELTKI